MSDLTQRLRDMSRRGHWPLIGDEAADLIEAQAERVRRLETEVACLKTVPMKYRRMEFNAQLQDENNSLYERVRVLREALADAIECVQDWGLYASPYFIEKHDLDGDVKRLRAALDATQ